jgi:hypothetical protein
MKHETNFPVDHLRQRALPYAPMAMPHQTVERSFEWGSVFRIFQFVRLRRG